MVKLIQHHTKYKEIHGIDEIVLMECGVHRRLHNRLRKEGKCKIPPNILSKISHAANQRTQKSKESAKRRYKMTKRTTKRITISDSDYYLLLGLKSKHQTDSIEEILKLETKSPVVGSVPGGTDYNRGYADGFRDCEKTHLAVPILPKRKIEPGAAAPDVVPQHG